MYSGDREPLEGAEELGTTGKDSGTGGRHPKGLRGVFEGCSSGGDFIWVKDVGDDPPYVLGTGKLPIHGR